MFRHAAELQRRGLVQRRGVWQAVLPQAIANRLAAEALQNTPVGVIEAQLVNGAPEHLLKSFSRRLGYLDDSKEAIALVKGWLAPGGLLGNPSFLNELGQAMFENVAPVAPEAVLVALERVFLAQTDDAVLQRSVRYLRLIRRGRNGRYRPPPARTRACGATAHGSYFGCAAARRLA